MLDLVASPSTPSLSRFDVGWDELDVAHAAIWDAISELFPAHAMVDQTDYGCLVISWSIRKGGRGGTHFAAPVIIRITPGLLVALWTSDDEGRRSIAQAQAQVVDEALRLYEPTSRVPSCGVITLGD